MSVFENSFLKLRSLLRSNGKSINFYYLKIQTIGEFLDVVSGMISLQGEAWRSAHNKRRERLESAHVIEIEKHEIDEGVPLTKNSFIASGM